MNDKTPDSNKGNDDHTIDKFFDYIREQQALGAHHRKREQRYRLYSKFGWMAFFFTGMVLYYIMFDTMFGNNLSKPEEYVAMVELNGAIMPKGGTSAEALISSLTDAFEDESAKGVILRINSPGGTPVQASIIYENIKRLRKEHPDVKFRVVAEDSIASGAYWVAVSSDKIYVDKSSMVGSIGVVMQGYGFTELASRFGVERRIFTAGENKVRLDPFKPLSDADRSKVRNTLSLLHENFIAAVKEGRNCNTGKPEECRIKLDAPGIFSGDFWVGTQAVELGLVDGIADIYQVMEADFGVEEYFLYRTKKATFGKLGAWLSSSIEDIVQDIMARNYLQPVAINPVR